MKTITHFFTAYKYKPLCLKRLSGWQSLLSFSEPLYCLVQSLHKSSILKTIVHVFKVANAGTVALVKSYTAKTNRRIAVGLGLMYVGATLFYFSYAVFDRERHILGYYHHNYWHLFFLIRYQISEIVFLIGLYIGLPQYSIKKGIAPYLGFLFMGLILNVTAESNADIWDTMSLVWWLVGTALSVALFLGLDHVAHRKFHREDSFDGRQKGLYQIGYDVDAEKWRSMMMETLRQKYEFNSKF
jgi:hypothetical protein